MNVGIIGLPQSGKKTLFRLLVGDDALPAHHDARALVRGVADVQDPRFDKLVEMYKPAKLTRARLDVVLLPKMEEHAVSEGGLFRDMGDIDAFCHVVRTFDDDSVYHVWGGPDPAREIEFVHAELILHDLLFVEKRIERIEKSLMKLKDERQEKERAVLLRFKDQLEHEKPLRLLDITPEEAPLIASYPLLTLRQLIVALNLGDDQIGNDGLIADLRGRFEELAVSFVQMPMLAETEIIKLETPEEREEFMRELGITDTALHMLTAQCIDALRLVSFFTIAPKEARQWFVRRDSLAPKVAGTIHSDMERGFIRAEVMKFDDLVEVGSEEALKSTGKYYVKGKDYVVVDGDILFIRFNV